MRESKIRALKKTDFAEWARLRRALWPDCQGARAQLEMRELMRARKKCGVIVIDRGGGKLGGFAELALRDGVDGAAREVTAFLEGWFVEPELRGRGWGRKLIVAAEGWAREHGSVELASDTELDDATAIAAHRAMGFRETFRTVQFLKRVRRKTDRRRS
jgi:aminoglycoside 6'-N-acetyltransferase I